MRPGEVLDAQADLIDRLDDYVVQRSVAVLAANQIGKMYTWESPTKAQSAENEKVIEKYSHLHTVLRAHLKTGSAYRVTHDMCQMVEWVSQQIDDYDAFYRELLPSESGIVCFDRPMPVRDIRGKTMLIHWLVWGPGSIIDSRTSEQVYGTLMWHFNDTWRQPDEVHQLFTENTGMENPEGWEEYNRRIGRWATVGMEIVFDGQKMGPPLWEASDEQRALLASEGFEAHPGTNAMRYAQALFLLLGQTLTDVVEEDIPRPFKRRATKKNLPPKVSVIRLRRKDPVGMEPGESEVEWQHQWMVKRHLRWQPYGPRTHTDHAHVYGPVEPDPETKHLVRRCVHEDCEAHLARIVIKAYWKGPEDKPILITDKVYSLDR